MARKKSSASLKRRKSKSVEQPLFYSQPVPLEPTKHGDLGLVTGFDLGFIRSANSVPINMIEMPQACHHYPIAFSPAEGAQPVAILGLRDDENLFLDSKNNWEPNTYVPAYIRRYPFIFSELPGRDELALCVDMKKEFVNEDSNQKFFGKDNAPTQLVKYALEFCHSYHAGVMQTMEFGASLEKCGLLVERQVELEAADGTKISFGGFRTVDEKKLAEMPDTDFLEWRKKGWLPFLYAHLFSGVQWQRLVGFFNHRQGQESFA